MPKNKPTKGLLKRIRFTKSGKVKFTRAFGRHLRSHKSGKLKRSYRCPAFAKTCDMHRVQSMLFRRVTAGAGTGTGTRTPATAEGSES